MLRDYRNIAEKLSESDNPIIRYKCQANLAETDNNKPAIAEIREQIKYSSIASALLADLAMSNPRERLGIATIYATLKYLADIYYPTGDATLIPYRDHVYYWLSNLEKEYDTSLFIRDKYRVHGSFHGNAIYASVTLGIDNEETRKLCQNLLRYQWPNGGWNCKKLPTAKGPTIVHTAYGLRGLVTYKRIQNTPEIQCAIEQSAEILLDRHVYLSRSDQKPLRPVFCKLAYPYPRLYNFMAGLHILARSGHIGDPRCTEALDLLESRFIEGQGWPMERRLYHNSKNRDGYTNARWQDEKTGKANQFLTVDALEILQKAGRFK